MFSVPASQGSGRAPSIRAVRRSVGPPVQPEEERRRTPRDDAPDDLLRLEDFNDDQLLRALWTRYERKEIYTWVGNVLVSVNPYRDVQAFSQERAARYASNNPPQAPHLFATVRSALCAAGQRHALLITGESGAGKTEATRAVLAFLAQFSGPSDSCPTDHIRDRLLRSTPVLEAFGNAHTRQNTNSSRFGKFIEVQLSPNLEVVGATLQPYMLEASRVAGDLPTGERTYHVFYLLRAALTAIADGTAPQRQFWTHLTHAPEWADLVKVAAAALGNSPRLDNGPPTDRCLEWFEALYEGLVKVGMRQNEVADCMRMVAAVSLLADSDADGSVLSVAASLLRVAEEDLQKFLSKVEVSVGQQNNEKFSRTRSEREAGTLRASFAQELYASLFGWLTRLVARGIAPATEVLEGGRALGLLDLYGFEVFSSNGFEQFLINYCNERLQQFFNQQVFTKEAEEYAAEGLDSDGQWRRLVTACQLPALALLEGEPGGRMMGAFGIINDRSRCGFEDSKQDGGSALAQAIASSCRDHPAYRTATRDSSRVFGIAHFAGEVFYEAAHFQRKNASAHKPDIVAFLKEKGGSFVREVVAGSEPEADNSRATGSTGPRRKLFGRTLISVFREELNELCAALEARECRHVRCLRPNDEQAPLVFDDASMLRQCRYSGLMEATRIRRQGFAHRRPLAVFAARFALLLGTRQARRLARNMPAEVNAAVACEAICQAASSSGISSDDAIIGHTKVFLRENALNWFEKARRQAAGCIVMALMRGNCTRQRWLRLRRSVVSAQAFVRARQARVFVHLLRAEKRAAEKRAAAERYMAELRAAEEAAALAEREAIEAAEVARLACACCIVQRWWRRRSARMCSMVAAVRHEQENLRKRASWAQADDIVVLLAPSNPASAVVSPEASYRGEWPPSVPTASAENLAKRCEQAVERLCRVAAECRDHHGRRIGERRGKDGTEDSHRKHHSQSSRSNRPPKDKDGKAKKVREASVRRRPAHEDGHHRPTLSRTDSYPMHRRRAGSPQAHDMIAPPSPRSMRRCYRQEIARLLAQHRQLRRRLPPELHGLPAQLMEAAHALNGPPVPLQVFAYIDEVLQTLKVALSEHAVSAYYPMPTFSHHQPSEAHMRPYDVNRASCPALLQNWQTQPTASHPSGFAFHAPPMEEPSYSVRQPCPGRSVIRTMSPVPMRATSPCLSVRATLPASARAASYQTPIRAAKVIATTVMSTPVAPTPRQVCRTPAPDGMSTPTVPVWAWTPPTGIGASVTVQAAPATMSRCLASPALDQTRETRRLLASVPTPLRSTCLASPCQQLNVPVVHATPSVQTSNFKAVGSTSVAKIGSGSVRVPTGIGSAHVPIVAAGSATLPTGSARLPTDRLDRMTMSPSRSPMNATHCRLETPGKSAAMPSATLVKQMVQRETTGPSSHVPPSDTMVPTWRSLVMTPSYGGAGPSRSFSPSGLHA